MHTDILEWVIVGSVIWLTVLNDGMGRMCGCGKNGRSVMRVANETMFQNIGVWYQILERQCKKREFVDTYGHLKVNIARELCAKNMREYDNEI